MVPVSADAYLTVANEILKLIDPSASPIARPKVAQGEWKNVDFGYMTFRRRITHEGGKTVLEMQLRPFNEDTTVKLSDIYLDKYECDETDPLSFQVKRGTPYDLKLHFNPAAGDEGEIGLQCVVSNRYGHQPGFIDHGTPNRRVGPVDAAGSTLVYGVPNLFSPRDVEVQPVELLVKGKRVPLLSTAVIRVAAKSKQGFDGVIPRGVNKFKLRYRWRLLPNRRWHEDTFETIL